MLDPTLTTDRIAEHLHRRVEPGGEHLAVIAQDLFGRPEGPRRSPQSLTHRLGAFTRNHLGAETYPGMTVDTGQHLGADAIGNREPAHDVHLPQIPHAGLIIPARANPRYAADSDGNGDTRRLANSISTAAAPYGRDRRSSSIAASTAPASDADTTLRPINQPVQTFGLIAGQPRVQRLPRHPHLLGDLAIPTTRH